MSLVPRHIIMPLDDAWPEDSPQLVKFRRERLAKGDPGPLHFTAEGFFTPMSMEEEG
jgi:hypothetical protein